MFGSPLFSFFLISCPSQFLNIDLICILINGLFVGFTLSILSLFTIFDIVYTRNSVLACGILLFKRYIKKPIVVKVPGLQSVEYDFESNFKRARVMSFFENYAYNKADLVLAGSIPVKEELFRRFRIPSEKVKIVTIGVDCNIFKPTHPKKKDGCTVGYMGSIAKYQGIEYLLNAIKILKHENRVMKLLMVGPITAEVKRKIAKMGIEDMVELRKTVAHEQIPLIFDEIDIFVIPRPTNKVNDTCIPMKLLEACAAGKAIVATDVGGLNVLLKNEGNALVVKPNASCIANAIMRLMDDCSLKDMIAEKARATALHYDWSLIAHRMLESFKDLLENKKSKVGIINN